MPSSPDPLGPEEPAPRRSPAPPGSTEDALRRLEQRLDRASEAAERLIAEAAAEAARAAGVGGADDTGRGGGNPGPDVGDHAPGAGGGAPGAGDHAPGAGGGAPGAGGGGSGAGGTDKPPPAGWQVPDDPPAGAASDIDPLLTLVHTLRGLIPPELQGRLAAALREFLLALRAVIDWYIDRLERRREESVELQDIPIL